MDRRSFLEAAAGAGALAAAGGLATPAISQRAAARALRFVPQADLANFDPIWITQYVVRNASAMVWDTLYGVDENLQPRRQMVESEEVSSDGLTWTFKLRPGLSFHDGEKVLAKDVVASLNRWAARDQLGLMVKAIENELTAVDDRTFRWVLKRPFSKMLLALGKSTTPCCFIMPSRIAATDPFKQIDDYVGSGQVRTGTPRGRVPHRSTRRSSGRRKHRTSGTRTGGACGPVPVRRCGPGSAGRRAPRAARPR